MSEKYIEVTCPGCNKKLLIDYEKKVVLKVIKGEKKQIDLDEFFEKEKNKGKELGDKFSSSLSYEKNKKAILEEKFKNLFNNSNE